LKGKDDLTGEPLIQRADDKEDVVLARLKNYENQIRPVIDFYSSKKVLETFTGNTSDYLWPLIKKSLDDHSRALQVANQQTPEEVTHTNHKFETDDFRRNRYENARKVVNKKFAINLVKEDPVVVCDQKVVLSSGGGPLGHPQVFINLDKPEVHDCNYSGRRFIKKKFYDASVHGQSITYEEYLVELRRKESEQ
jgi:uncharacterized Zn-finger protein